MCQDYVVDQEPLSRQATMAEERHHAVDSLNTLKGLSTVYSLLIYLNNRSSCKIL